MTTMLSDLFAHQSWADAEHWKAFDAFPQALKNKKFFAQLHHVHLVQHGFLAVCRKDRSFRPTKPDDFVTVSSLKQYAMQFHRDVLALVASLSDVQLEIPIVIPWFSNPPLHLTVERALTQCIMHSQYHRGQNAARLRELGGEPPSTDLIVWYWKGMPDPDWRE